MSALLKVCLPLSFGLLPQERHDAVLQPVMQTNLAPNPVSRQELAELFYDQLNANPDFAMRY
ncbi:MAG: hypothetical protein AB8B82_13080 [Roseovarius sp.]